MMIAQWARIHAMILLVICSIGFGGHSQGHPLSKSHPSIYEGHTQTLEDRETNSPYKVFGKLYDRETHSFLTAVLIAPCHIITARHSILTKKDAERRRGEWSFKFGAGPPTEKSDFISVVDAIPVAFGNFESDDKGVHNIAQDWMILRLSECLGANEKYGHAIIDPIKLSDLLALTDNLEKAGYSRTDSARDGVSVDKNCNATNILLPSKRDSSDLEWQDTWIHNCSALKGDSGGALFYMKGGVPRLVCLISISPDENPTPASIPYNPADGKTANVCVAAVAFASQVRAAIDANDN